MRGGGNGGRRLEAWKDVLLVEAGAPCQKFSIIRGDGETTLFHLSFLVDSDAPKGEQFDVSIDNPLVETLVPAVLADVLILSHPACKYEGEGGGQVHCKDHIAKGGAGKKELRPLRLERPHRVAAGVGRAAKSSTVRQLVMSPAGGTRTWMERRAAWWFMMMGKAEGLFRTRHPTLSMG